MILKDFLSQEISSKYCTNKEGNKSIIQRIYNQGNKEINKILDLTFREWIEIFLMKKEKNELVFGGLDELLNELQENENDPQYFVDFVFLLYNYEKWFQNKKPRKSKKKNNDYYIEPLTK